LRGRQRYSANLRVPRSVCAIPSTPLMCLLVERFMLVTLWASTVWRC